MKKKPDYSRLVTLSYTPTEGAILLGAVIGLRKNLERMPPQDDVDEALRFLLEDTVQRISLQLKQLGWPLGHNRTPFPV